MRFSKCKRIIFLENPIVFSEVTENHDFGGMTYEGSFFESVG